LFKKTCFYLLLTAKMANIPLVKNTLAWYDGIISLKGDTSYEINMDEQDG